jgi:hypothetical protein
LSSFRYSYDLQKEIVMVAFPPLAEPPVAEPPVAEPPVPIPQFFQAQWTDQNAHLRITVAQRVQSVVLPLIAVIATVISFVLFPKIGIVLGVVLLIGFLANNIIGSSIKKIVLPAARGPIDRIRFCFQERRPLEPGVSDTHGTVNTEYDVRTADGVILSALHIRSNNLNLPTVLFFNPNAVKELNTNFIDRALALKGVRCNIISFNYRGVGSSEGHPHRACDLVLDGDAMLQFAINHLRIPPERLIVYGWSLGGAVAANAVALHPECLGPVVLDRTFSSTARYAAHLAEIFFGRFQRVFSAFVRWKEWNLDAQAAAERIPHPERIHICFHDQDEVIDSPTQLREVLGTHQVELRDGNFAHGGGLREFAAGQNLIRRIFNLPPMPSRFRDE